MNIEADTGRPFQVFPPFLKKGLEREGPCLHDNKGRYFLGCWYFSDISLNDSFHENYFMIYFHSRVMINSVQLWRNGRNQDEQQLFVVYMNQIYFQEYQSVPWLFQKAGQE